MFSITVYFSIHHVRQNMLTVAGEVLKNTVHNLGTFLKINF